MTFQFQGGGVIDGCLAFYRYKTPCYGVNQQATTVAGKFKSDVIYHVDEVLYIADWMVQESRAAVMAAIYDVDSNRSNIDGGYFLSEGPEWVNVVDQNGLPIYTAKLKFRKENPA